MSGSRLVGLRVKGKSRIYKPEIYTDGRREIDPWQCSPPQTPTTSDDDDDGPHSAAFDDALVPKTNHQCTHRLTLVKRRQPTKYRRYHASYADNLPKQQPKRRKLNAAALPFVPTAENKKKEKDSTVDRLESIEEDRESNADSDDGAAAAENKEHPEIVDFVSLVSVTESEQCDYDSDDTNSETMDDDDTNYDQECELEIKMEFEDEDEAKKDFNNIEFAEIVDDDQDEESGIYDQERKYFDDDRFVLLVEEILNETSPFKRADIGHNFGYEQHPHPHFSVFRPNNIWTVPAPRFQRAANFMRYPQ